MTKSLTEKWKDGELPEGTYYVMFLCGRYGTYEFEKFKGFGFDNDLAYIKEVLAPVPSYDEYKKMDSELKELACKNDSLSMECGKLQEQLKEANKVVKLSIQYLTQNTLVSTEGVIIAGEKYLKKWGIPSEKCQKQGDFPSKKCKEVK